MKFIVLVLVVTLLTGCNDEDLHYLDYDKHIKITNQSGKRVTMKYFGSNLISEMNLENDSTYSFGLIKDSISNSHLALNADSIWVIFSDNKKMKYVKNQCEAKNLMCENSYICGKGNVDYVTYCKFTLTADDYKNAK
jgi:hypothetical protein